LTHNPPAKTQEKEAMNRYRGEINTSILFEYEAENDAEAEEILESISLNIGNSPIPRQIGDTENHESRRRKRKLRMVWAFVSDYKDRQRIIKPVADHPVDLQDAGIAHTMVISMPADEADSLEHAQALVELEFERKGAMTIGGKR
jgi:hypothetical protein